MRAAAPSARAVVPSLRRDFSLAQYRVSVLEARETGPVMILQTEGWPGDATRAHASLFIDKQTAAQLDEIAAFIRGML